MDCAPCRFSTGGDHIRKLHDKLAIYVWECFTWQGFGTAAVHYARGTDATSFAAGDTLCHQSAACLASDSKRQTVWLPSGSPAAWPAERSWLTALLHQAMISACLVQICGWLTDPHHPCCWYVMVTSAWHAC